jgi:hypothetical protein
VEVCDFGYFLRIFLKKSQKLKFYRKGKGVGGQGSGPLDLVLGLPNLKILDCDVELKFVALVHRRRRGCVMEMCGWVHLGVSVTESFSQKKGKVGALSSVF